MSKRRSVAVAEFVLPEQPGQHGLSAVAENARFKPRIVSRTKLL